MRKYAAVSLILVMTLLAHPATAKKPKPRQQPCTTGQQTATAPTSTSMRAQSAEGSQSDAGAIQPDVSSTGRYVAFASDSRNLLEGQPPENDWDSDVFITDILSEETLWVSYNYQTDEPAQGLSESPSVSSDGRYVAYFSSAENLVDGDVNGWMDVIRFDQATGEQELVSVALSPGGANEHSGAPSISADGRYVAFSSVASNLVTGDTNNLADIFVRDMITNTTSRVSVSSQGSQAAGGNSYYPAVSADGRFVTFSSSATNLAPDENSFIQDIFVHDRNTGSTELISVSSAGDEADSLSDFPSISGDGRYVAFHSLATTLWSGDSNGKYDVFLRDRVAGTTTLMSRVGAALGNGHSSYPDIDEAGRYVAFQSAATNLWTLEPDTNGVADIYEYDRPGDQIMGRLSVGPDDIWSDGASSDPAISNDNLTVAFASNARNLVTGGDTNFSPDVFTHLWVEGRTKCQTDRRSDPKPVPLPFSPGGPPNPKPPQDDRCQDLTTSGRLNEDPNPELTEAQRYDPHYTEGVIDTFTATVHPTEDPPLTDPGTAPVYLRYGYAQENVAADSWSGWGYRKIAAHHGWGPDVKAQVSSALQLDTDPDQPSGGGWTYQYDYPGDGVTCRRKVVVQYWRRGFELSQGYHAPGIINTYAWALD